MLILLDDKLAAFEKSFGNEINFENFWIITCE